MSIASSKFILLPQEGMVIEKHIACSVDMDDDLNITVLAGPVHASPFSCASYDVVFASAMIGAAHQRVYFDDRMLATPDPLTAYSRWVSSVVVDFLKLLCERESFDFNTSNVMFNGGVVFPIGVLTTGELAGIFTSVNHLWVQGPFDLRGFERMQDAGMWMVDSLDEGYQFGKVCTRLKSTTTPNTSRHISLISLFMKRLRELVVSCPSVVEPPSTLKAFIERYKTNKTEMPNESPTETT